MKKVRKSNIKEILALTSMQEGMLFHYLKSPKNAYYFVQLTLDICGEINRCIFKKAWEYAADNNEMLRTFFLWEGIEKPVQVILKNHQPETHYFDFSRLDAERAIAEVQTITCKDKEKNFDLREVPFRVTLCKTGDASYRLIFSNHHILWDGWSTGIILQEFFYAYEQLTQGNALSSFKKPPFKAFIQALKKQEHQAQETFWTHYLEGFDNYSPLPIKTKPQGETFSSASYTFSFDKAITAKLKQFSRQHKITPASLLYGGWGLLLQRYNDCNDVLFGTTLSGRNLPLKGIEQMVGLFINTVPLRAKSEPGQNILYYLRQLQFQLQTREPYTNTSLVEIKRYSGIDNNKELFDSLLVVENYPLSNRVADKIGQLDVRFHSLEENSNYDLTLALSIAEEISVAFRYNTEVLAPESIQAMAGHFHTLLNNIVRYPGAPVSQLDILTPAEKHYLVSEVNRTDADYPREHTIDQLIKNQAEHRPDAVALGCMERRSGDQENINRGSIGMRHITYRQLEHRATLLARSLRSRGISPGTIGAVLLKPDLDMMIAFLAILKAGGAFMPIDHTSPAQRISFMLRDSHATLVLSQKSFQHILLSTSRVIYMEDPDTANLEQNLEPIDRLAQLRDPAYIIYTSGSTGFPKAVVIRHYSLLNLCNWHNHYYQITSADKATKFVNPAFDVTVWEIFPYWLAGASLFVINEAVRWDAHAINDFFERNNISVTFLPTQLYQQFMQQLNKSLRLLLTGGDKLKHYRPGNFQLVNNYGPTESTVITTCFPVTGQHRDIPIGKPIDNTRLFVLDKHHRLQPAGVPGQLCISGDGLACGYLNRPELTANTFVPNPYEPNRDMYKTGDRVQRLHDGNIRFLGRMDQQVKIRGFRIELGEIEKQILQYPGIRDALVISINRGNGENSLYAYIVPLQEKFNREGLQDFLGQHLPGYMIPNDFMTLEALPVTANGKVNHKALPTPTRLPEHTDTPPSGPVEEKIAQIWAEVLGLNKDTICANSRFFQLGGHSLNATILLAKLQKEFNVAVTMEAIFKRHTLAELAIYIRDIKEDSADRIEPTAKRDYYPLSAMQKQFYIQQQMVENSIDYNIPHLIMLTGPENKINLGKITAAFNRLVQRHESLRSSFLMKDGRPVQLIHDKVPFEIEYFVIDRAEIPSLIERFIQPFDLSAPPLFRVALVRVELNRHLLCLDMNHIISDGFSNEILEKDFRDILNGETPAPLNIQYKDFVLWQNSAARQEAVQQQREFWLNQFTGTIPGLNLPIDYPRRFVRHFEGKSVHYEIPTPMAKILRTIVIDEGATLFMLMLAVYYVLLAKLSSQEDIVIGTALSGRRHADLIPVVGLFFNTLALRLFPTNSKTFRHFFKEVKEHTFKTFENQDYGFGNLVEELVSQGRLTRTPGRNPLFDTMMAFQNYKKQTLKNNQTLDREADLQLETYVERESAKFDLLLNIKEQQDTITLTLDFSTTLFKPSTAENILTYYVEILEQVIESPDILLGDISLTRDSIEIKCRFENSDFSDFKF